MVPFEWIKWFFVLCSRFVDYTLTRIVKFSLWDCGLRQMVSWILYCIACSVCVCMCVRECECTYVYACTCVCYIHIVFHVKTCLKTDGTIVATDFGGGWHMGYRWYQKWQTLCSFFLWRAWFIMLSIMCMVCWCAWIRINTTASYILIQGFWYLICHPGAGDRIVIKILPMPVTIQD